MRLRRTNGANLWYCGGVECLSDPIWKIYMQKGLSVVDVYVFLLSLPTSSVMALQNHAC